MSRLAHPDAVLTKRLAYGPQRHQLGRFGRWARWAEVDDQLVVTLSGRTGEREAVLDERVGRGPDEPAVQVVLGVSVHPVEHELRRAGQLLGPQGQNAAVPPLGIFPVPHGQDVLAEEQVLGQQAGAAQVELDIAGDARLDGELVTVLARPAIGKAPVSFQGTLVHSETNLSFILVCLSYSVSLSCSAFYDVPWPRAQVCSARARGIKQFPVPSGW